MTEQISSDFLREIPKTDLHVHLDGSLRIPTLIELAKEAGVELPSYEEQGLKDMVFKDSYADLPEYLQGFAYTVAVMQTSENIERIAYELVLDNLEEGVRYLEVRFAPQLHLRDDFPILDVLEAVSKGMDRAKKEHNRTAAVLNGEDICFEYGIIVCALRSFHADMSVYYANLFKALPTSPKKNVFATASLELIRAAWKLIREHELPIVGFDLAGEEAGYPAGDHKEAFGFAQSHFIRKTVHAGEAYGPESIFHAITECQANRIGHGTFLFAADRVLDPEIEDKAGYTEGLAQYVASQRITVEVCLTSNLQTTPSIACVSDHPVRKMIDRNLSVSICTDNRLVSNTSVTRELQLVVDETGINRHQLRNLVIAGFKGSFFPHRYSEKRAYVRQVINRYEQLEAAL